jgi:hypothetical protein
MGLQRRYRHQTGRSVTCDRAYAIANARMLTPLRDVFLREAGSARTASRATSDQARLTEPSTTPMHAR